MKQEIKNKLFTAYYKELQRSLVLNELFSVDVELVDGDALYEIYSTILAESDEVKHYDPLLPPEYSKLCLSAPHVTLCFIDENGKMDVLSEEANEIVEMALNEIR